MPEGKFADVLDEPINKSKKFGDILDADEDSSDGFFSTIKKGFTDEFSPYSDAYEAKKLKEQEEFQKSTDPEVQKALAHQVRPVREGTTLGIRNDVLTKPFQTLKEKTIGNSPDMFQKPLSAVAKVLDIPFEHGIGGGAQAVQSSIQGGEDASKGKVLEGGLKIGGGVVGAGFSALMGGTPVGIAFSATDEAIRNTVPELAKVIDKTLDLPRTAVTSFDYLVDEKNRGILEEGGNILNTVWMLGAFHGGNEAGKWAWNKIKEIRKTAPQVAKVLDEKLQKEHPKEYAELIKNTDAGLTEQAGQSELGDIRRMAENRLLPEQTARFVVDEKGVRERVPEPMEIGDIKHRTGGTVKTDKLPEGVQTVEQKNAGKKFEPLPDTGHPTNKAVNSGANATFEEAQAKLSEYKANIEKLKNAKTREEKIKAMADHGSNQFNREFVEGFVAKNLNEAHRAHGLGELETKLNSLSKEAEKKVSVEEPKVSEPKKSIIPDSQFENLQPKLGAVLNENNKPTGWMQLSMPDHVTLVNTATKEAVRFDITSNSSKEKLLREKQAREYASKNPIEAKAEEPVKPTVEDKAPQDKKFEFKPGRSREAQVQERIDELHKELADNEPKLQNDIFEGKAENQTIALNRKNEIAKELERLNNKVMPEAKAIDAKIENQKNPKQKELLPDELTELKKSKEAGKAKKSTTEEINSEKENITLAIEGAQKSAEKTFEGATLDELIADKALLEKNPMGYFGKRSIFYEREYQRTRDPQAKKLADEYGDINKRIAKEQKEVAEPKQPEAIKTAAIQVDGRTYTGRTHAEAIDRARLELYPDMKYDDFLLSGIIEEPNGFITSRGRYVGRDEATRIAKKAKIKMSGTELTGEDVRSTNIPVDREKALSEIFSLKEKVEANKKYKGRNDDIRKIEILASKNNIAVKINKSTGNIEIKDFDTNKRIKNPNRIGGAEIDTKAKLLQDMPEERVSLIKKVLDYAKDNLDIDMSANELRNAIMDIKVGNGREGKVRAQEVLRAVEKMIDEGTIGVKQGAAGFEPQRAGVPLNEVLKHFEIKDAPGEVGLGEAKFTFDTLEKAEARIKLLKNRENLEIHKTPNNRYGIYEKGIPVSEITISRNSDEVGNYVIVYAKDINGTTIGKARLVDRGDNNLEGLDIQVDKNHLRKGVASAMYSRLMENGYKLKPSPLQTKEGKKFWESFSQKTKPSNAEGRDIKASESGDTFKKKGKRIISDDTLKQARKDFEEGTSLPFANPMANPKTIGALVKIAAYHVETGARTFKDFTMKMKDELGETFNKIKHRLAELYSRALNYLKKNGGEPETKKSDKGYEVAFTLQNGKVVSDKSVVDHGSLLNKLIDEGKIAGYGDVKSSGFVRNGKYVEGSGVKRAQDGRGKVTAEKLDKEMGVKEETLPETKAKSNSFVSETIEKAKAYEQSLIRKGLNGKDVAKETVKYIESELLKSKTFENLSQEGRKFVIDGIRKKMYAQGYTSTEKSGLGKVKEKSTEIGAKNVLGQVAEKTTKDPSAIKDRAQRFLSGAENRLQSKEARSIVDEMKEVWDRRYNIAGELLGIYRQARKKSQKLEFANKVFAKVAKMAEEAGVMVKGEDGSLSPFKPIAKNYIPRMLKEEVREIIYDDIAMAERRIGELAKKKNSFADEAVLNQLRKSLGESYVADRGVHRLKPKTVEAINNIMKQNKVDFSRAYEILKSGIHDEKYNPQNNIEKHRKLMFPSDFYETNLDKIVPHYILGVSRAIAEVKKWGAERELLTERINSLWNKNKNDYEITKDLWDIQSGVYAREHSLSPSMRKISDAFINIEVGSKIGLGTAVIPNMVQFKYSTLPKAGVIKTVKGMYKYATSHEIRQAVTNSGATVPEAIAMLTGYDTGGGVLAKATKFSMEGFSLVNRAQKVLAASAAQVAIPEWYKLANGNSFRKNFAIRQLKSVGIDHTKPLTQDAIQRGTFRFASDTQLARDPFNEPLWMNNPKLRALALFKRFGYKQFNLVRREVYGELKHGNVMPLLRIAAGGALGGHFVMESKKMLRELLSGKPVHQKDLPWWRDLINMYAAAGTLGYVSDVAGSYELDGEDWAANALKNARRAVTPVPVSQFEDAWDAGERVIKAKDSWKQVGKEIMKQTPLGRMTQPVKK